VRDEAYATDVGHGIYKIFFEKCERGHFENLGLLWKILKYTRQIFDGTERNFAT
jgi:hypothetical protein